MEKVVNYKIYAGYYEIYVTNKNLENADTPPVFQGGVSVFMIALKKLFLLFFVLIARKGCFFVNRGYIISKYIYV